MNGSKFQIRKYCRRPRRSPGAKAFRPPQAFSHCVGRKLPLLFSRESTGRARGFPAVLESGLKNSHKGKGLPVRGGGVTRERAVQYEAGTRTNPALLPAKAFCLKLPGFGGRFIPVAEAAPIRLEGDHIDPAAGIPSASGHLGTPQSHRSLFTDLPAIGGSVTAAALFLEPSAGGIVGAVLDPLVLRPFHADASGGVVVPIGNQDMGF